MRSWKLFGSLTSLLTACGGNGSGASDEAVTRHSAPLIGGVYAGEGEYASTLWFQGTGPDARTGSTGVKIGPRHILISSAFAMDNGGQPRVDIDAGRTILVNGSAGVTSDAYHEEKIEVVHVSPLFAQSCREGSCSTRSHSSPFAPDIAVIVLAADIPYVQTATVDLNPVARDDEVVAVGLGCETLGGEFSTRKYQRTKALGSDLIGKNELPEGLATYLVTSTREHDISSYSQCNGDNGAPVYRPGTNLLVGINTSLTDTTNYVVRVDQDSRHAVGAWLQSLGATVRGVGPNPSPYRGKQRVPGVIQVEDYDRGAQGVAYKDSDTINQPLAHLRNEAVDIDPTTDDGGGYNIGGIQPGEWLNFTIDVAQEGRYDVLIRAASPSDGGKMHLELDGRDVTGPISLPVTGDWQRFTTTFGSPAQLPAGTHSLRAVFDSAGFNVNWLELAPASDCQDHAQSGHETDVDCGGPCAKCRDGQKCSTSSDCESNACAAGLCQPPTTGGGGAGSGGMGATGGLDGGGLSTAGAGGMIGLGGASPAGGGTAGSAASGAPAMSGTAGSAPTSTGGSGSEAGGAAVKTGSEPDAGCSISARREASTSALFALALAAAAHASRRWRRATSIALQRALR